MSTSINQTGSVVIGYFATGHAAHRAIHALVDEGFLPSEIGAAFHVGADGAPRANQQASRQPNVGGSLREELGTTLPEGHASSSTTFGAASDTTAVQPAALGGGAGTPFVGAGRPGPITGSSLANSGLPSELKSTLPHDAELPSGASSQPPNAYANYSPEPSHTLYAPDHDHKELENDGWLEKLKHLFGAGHPDKERAAAFESAEQSIPKAHVTQESQDFGTGEGHLMLQSKGRRYSQPAFESSFSGYGVEPGRARHLSHQIGQGGAIVTVHATTRAIEAERILELHGGEVRFAGGGSNDDFASDGQVEVFGTVGRDYPTFD